MKTPFPIWRGSLFVISTMLIGSALLIARPGQSGKTYTLSGVTISGAKRFTQAQLISASGLKKGQQIDLPGIDAAADRLFKSGALANISYTYRTSAAGIEVQFKLAEAAKFVPCTYDNFVWFTDEELIAAARKEVPLFDGSLPIGGELPNQVSESLEHFLQEHSIKGSVSATISGSMGGPVNSYDLRVFDISIPVKSVTVKGGPLTQESLAKAIHLISLSDYSRSVARGVGQSGLTEAYQDEGYLQAKFSDPQVMMKDPQGHDATLGVTLIYDVIPGPQFRSTGVTWSGNQALSESDLSKLMEVKPGDIASREKFNFSWADVRGRYGKDGYLAAHVETTPEFDAAKAEVHYQAKISEGAQYHMGIFTATGVTEILANKLKGVWRLRPGQVYDASYENTYVRQDMGEVMRPSATSRFTVNVNRKINSETHVVDVELEIK
ncbi:MAG TPA: POTRA domain-containing protein [Candidatus Acidoferrales bacterium]|jgi:outer membrane protein assembly factor BamA